MMRSQEIGNFLAFTLGLALLLLLVFGVLQWLHVPSGSFLDWLIGIASFWWLLVIVTVPWNIHFEAKQVLAAAAISRQKGIAVDARPVQFAQTVAQRALWIALVLHLLSALGLYALAATGISSIGYLSSLAALLLTGLRPALAFYRYLALRLGEIQQEIKYPREDVVELRQRVVTLEAGLQTVQYQLNLDIPHADSWATAQETGIKALQQRLDQLATHYQTLKTDNQADHAQLAREAKSAIAQLNEDSQFLEHVREIIRFFKAA
jgi:hypothetical protein